MVRRFTSDDQDAPAISNVGGTWQKAMRAILCDGYGNTQPAGWDLIFQRPGNGNNNNYAMHVVRARVGTRQYYWLNETFGAPYNNTNVGGSEGYTAPEVAVDYWGPSDPVVFPRCNGPAPHKWICYADERTCYFYLETIGGSGQYNFVGFGDYWSYGATDKWNAMVLRFRQSRFQSSNATEVLHDSMRTYNGGLKKQGLNLHTDHALSPGALPAGLVPYPNPTDQLTWIAPYYIGGIPGSPIKRGKLRGLWLWCHPETVIADRDRWVVTAGEFAGKTFEVVRTVTSTAAGATGVHIIEASNTWLTNA